MAVVDERRKLLCGHSFQAVAQRSNVVRIFLNFVHERNRLFNHALPELESWCQEKGLHFQVVDMRWGIRDNVSIDHGGPAVCLREIERCRQMSIGPNFVAFVGDRYGRRPIPATIPSADFGSILMQIQDADEKALLIASYRLDKNALPPVYLIQSSMQNEKSQYSEDVLRDILTAAAQMAVDKGIIRYAHPYSASITEQEIWKGILLSDEPEMHSLVFVRNFQHSVTLQPKYRSVTKQFADFIPSVENDEIDPVSTKMLHDLKNYILPSKLDDSNLFRYSIPFDEKMGIDPMLPVHANYLKVVNDTFLKNTKELIDEGWKQMQTSHMDDELYTEVASHANFAVAKAKLYCGKTKFLTKLYNKLMDPENHQPHILYGDSGVGKTATIAKLILEAHKNILNDKSKPANIVYRFLGTTPDSSTLDRLIVSLTKQICNIYGSVQQKESDMTDFTQLIDVFYRTLEMASLAANRSAPLVIILDSLDQLSPNYGAHLMTWLRSTVPSHIAILLTTMPGAFGILERLQSRFAPTTIELTESANEKASTVLMRLLKQNHRTITSAQAKIVAKVFQVSQSPLLLHLTLIETRRWRSFSPPSELRLGTTVTEAIDVLFDRMENVHGRILVGHALGYLVASKNGLTAQEMEDVLSLDDQVLDDVYQYWAPPSNTEMRIPPLIWARLQEDMSDFIVLKQRDGVTVMGMYHKQFTDEVRVRYLGDQEIRRKLHQTLAEYFDGTWATRAKATSLKILNNEHREFNRKVRAQPLMFSKDLYNLRKLNELPHHLIAANDSTKLTSDVLANIDWLEVKCQASGVNALIADIDEYLSDEKGSNVNESNRASIVEIRQALRLAKPTVDFADRTTLADGSVVVNKSETCLATELLGRLHDQAKQSDIIARLLLGARKWCENGCAERLLLVPENQCFSSSNGPLETTLALYGAKAIVAVVHSVELDTTVTVDTMNTIRLWDLSTDTVVHTAKIGNRYSCNVNGTQDAVVLSNDNKFFYSWNSDDGLLCFGLIAAAEIYHRSPEQLISNVEAVDIKIQQLKTSDAKKLKSVTQFCVPLNNNRLALSSSNSQEVLIVDSVGPNLLKRFRLSACSSSLSFDGDATLFIGCNDSLAYVNLSDWQFDIESFGMTVFSAECISIAKKRHLALIGFSDMKTVLITRRIKKSDSGGKRKIQSTTLHNSQRAQFSQAHEACVCVGFKQDAVVLLTSDWSKKKLKQKAAICSMKIAEHPNNKQSALLFVGSADMIAVYDCYGECALVQEISGMWGQPNRLHVGGQFLFVASTQSPFVKVWNTRRLVDNNNNLHRELGKTELFTCWLSDKSTMCCHLSESKNTVMFGATEEEKSEVNLTGNVNVVFCLVTDNDLIYVTDVRDVYRLDLSSRNAVKLSTLLSPAVKFSHSKEQSTVVFLLENNSICQLNTKDWTVKNVSKAISAKQHICDLCIIGNCLLLLCEKETVLISFNDRQKKLIGFDWAHSTVLAYAGCRDVMAVCLQGSAGTATQQIQLWNLKTMKQIGTVDLSDMASVDCMCISADGRYLLVGGSDRFIRVVDAQSGAVLRQNEYMYSPIRSIAAFDDQLIGVLLGDGRFCRLKIMVPGSSDHAITKAKQNRSSTCVVL